MTDLDIRLSYMLQQRDPYSGPRLYQHLERFSDYEIGRAVDAPDARIAGWQDGGFLNATAVSLSAASHNAYRLLGEPRFLHNPHQLGRLLRMGHVIDFLHRDKTRRTGDREVDHPLAVYWVAVAMGLYGDDVLLNACLGHDELEDSPITRAILRHFFGREITFLIDGVTSERRLGLIASYNKLVYYASQDPRVYLIKLFDNGCNLKTILGKGDVEMDRAWQLRWLAKLLGPDRDALLRCRRLIRYDYPDLFLLTEPIFEENMAEALRIQRLLSPGYLQPILDFA